LSGGNIAAASNCTFGVNVVAVAVGAQVNTTGNVTSTNGGAGNTATATVDVLAADLTISKTHTGNFFQGQTNATYSIVVSNAGAGATAGNVTVTDAPPTGYSVTSLTGTGWTCTVATLSCTRSDALAFGASYPAITVTGSVAATADPNFTNTATVAGGGELNTSNDSATDATTVSAPPDFTLGITSQSVTVNAGGTANYVFTITPTSGALSTGITFAVSGLPQKTTFTIAPTTVTLGTSPQTVSLAVMTSGGDPFIAHNSSVNRGIFLAMFFPVSGLVFVGFGPRKRLWKRGKAGWLLCIMLIGMSSAILSGCASVHNFQHLGTPPGTYQLTVTATAGTTQHSTPVTLIVQQ
jgi:hypothetical protein